MDDAEFEQLDKGWTVGRGNDSPLSFIYVAKAILGPH